jgi:hypothetical protein
VDPATLTDLLAGKHLNMDERVARGAWPHPPLRYRDLVSHLVDLIRREHWFPAPLPTTAGTAPDYVIIEHRGFANYLVHSQSSNAWGGVAGRGCRRFFRPQAAARFYLKWGLHLPGDLDGWKVVP